MLSRDRILVFVVALVAACGTLPPDPVESIPVETPAFVVDGCEVVVPRALPSGAAPGSFHVVGDGRVAWGVGSDRVVEAVGELAIGAPDELGIPDLSEQRVIVQGSPGVVIPIGDEGAGKMVITWAAGRCRYTVWLAPGITLDGAIRYAAAL